MTQYKLVDGVEIELTQEEIAQRKAEEDAWKAGAFDRAIAQLRQRRNALLASSDWTVLSDSPLSQTEKTTVSIPMFAFRNRQLVNLSVSVTREEFEKCLEEPLNKTKNCIEQAIKDANIKVSDIDEVVFVGGSTRIPYVSKKVQEWTGKRPNKSINPDEAVSIGAAIQASVLSGSSDKLVFLLDVTPLTLGIETLGGVMNAMIRRNTQVPTEYREIFTTAEDNQSSVDVKVYQGERPQTKYNHFLGEFKLDNIAPTRRGVPKIEIGRAHV